MVDIGYALSSEDHDATELVRLAHRAEQVGFDFAMISDHYHPWTRHQGHSPFVWGVLGGIAQVTERLTVGTAVTCPTMRIHPAIVAQAVATAASMLPGRFLFGVGSGENLNEHVLGLRWPRTDIRHEMLEEAVGLIRRLWEGKNVSHRGRHYTVENARVFTLPDTPPPVLVAAGAKKAAALAGRIGDGLIATSPDPDLMATFEAAGGTGRPRYGGLKVCWAPDEAEARRLALEWWPTTALGGELGQELPTPAHFEQACARVTEDDVAESVVCGPDPERHLAAIDEFAKAGFDHVYVHQVTPAQDGFFDFYAREVIPRL